MMIALIEKSLLILDEKGKAENSENPDLSVRDCRIDCKNVTVKWPSARIDNKGNDNNTLTDVSFTVKSGQLTAIIGQVGSGKVYTSLYLANFK